MGLRFKRDDGTKYPTLEKHTLGELAEIKDSARVPNAKWVKEGVPYLRAADFNNNNLDGELFISLNDYVEYKEKTGAPEYGDLMFVSGGNVGLSVLKKDDSPVYVQGGAVLYVKTSTSDCLDGEYLHQYFQSPPMIRYIDIAAVGGTITHFTLKPALQTPINLPCLEEQQKIASFLSSVDEVISASEEEVKNLEEQKKGMMQKIFSQEVRFKKDDGTEYTEWEEKAFSDMFDILRNNTLSRADLTYDSGTVKNIHYGDVLIKFGSYIDALSRDIPFVSDVVDTSKIMKYKLQSGDVIFADTAEDETCGKVTEVIGIEDIDIVSGLHTIPCRPKKTFAFTYLGYYLNSYSYHSQLLPLMQGTKVTSISKAAIQDTKMSIPCFEEQQKIASFLSSFDEAIDAAKKELECWKEIKKGLLQQLFE